MLDRLIALFRRMFISVGALPFLLVLLIIFFATQNPRFLSEVNILNIAQQGIYLLLISLAQMMVLVSGGFRSIGRGERRTHQHWQCDNHGRGIWGLA